METKRLITAVLITIIAVFAYQAGMNWLGNRLGYDLRPNPAAETQQAQDVGPATLPATGPATTPVDGTVAQTPQVAPATTQPSAWSVSAPADAPQESVIIGSGERNDPGYHLALNLVPHGAAVEEVVLNQFTATVESPDPFVFQRPLAPDRHETRALATLAIVVDGYRISLDGAPWALESSNANSATYVATVARLGQPALRVRKRYQLLPPTDPSQGYEVVLTQTVENLTAEPHEVQLVMNGTVTPPPEVDRGPDRHVVAGYEHQEGNQKYITVSHHGIEVLTPESRTLDITTHEDLPLRWAGLLSVYFNAIARPVPVEGDLKALPLAAAEAIAFNPDAPPHERDAAVRFTTEKVSLAAAETAALGMRVFFGPRQRSLLKEDYFAALGFDQTLVLTGGICAVCTFQWLIDLLVLLLRGFHAIFRDWGLAIICLVVLVRLLLHPITKKSQISMMKMAKLGPEIERLRKKHGDNKEELNKAMIEFHKQQGVGPYLGCLPMFLQMPIWIALWSALYSTFELRHASFLYGFTWIDDLAKPDNLVKFPRAFDVFFLHITGINLLPILMGVVFYVQMKLQPRPATMTKEQEQQQKIMMWMMPLLFPLMLYSGPSGLNLYILTSTLIGIWESKRIRDHIKQREEAEAQQRVVIDAKPTRGSKQSKKFEPPPGAPKRGFAAWLANLQEWADQQRHEQDRRGKDKA